MELVLEERGGCSCQHPTTSPPCWACSTPPSDRELQLALELYQEEDEQAAENAVDQLLRDEAAKW